MLRKQQWRALSMYLRAATMVGGGAIGGRVAGSLTGFEGSSPAREGLESVGGVGVGGFLLRRAYRGEGNEAWWGKEVLPLLWLVSASFDVGFFGAICPWECSRECLFKVHLVELSIMRLKNVEKFRKTLRIPVTPLGNVEEPILNLQTPSFLSIALWKRCSTSWFE